MSSLMSTPVAKSDKEELLYALRCAIPLQNRKLWCTTTQFQSLLTNASLPSLPDKFVNASLQQANKFISHSNKCNRFRNKFWCCFDSGDVPFDSPKMQLNVVK